MNFPIIVIADDLSGAAEIAGIGLRYGLSTRLVLDARNIGTASSTLTVINADTRAMPKSEAMQVVAELMRQIDRDAVFFKKIDSVMRGHVVGEIDAVLNAADRFDRVLIVPQNPTRKRVIDASGNYLVEGQLLAQTVFANDPDHPTRLSNVVERLSSTKWPATLRQNPAEPLVANAVNIGVGDRFEQIQAWARHLTPATLAVGAADLFTAILVERGHTIRDASPAIPISGRRLHVCGTTTLNSRRALRAYAVSKNIPILGADVKGAGESIRQHGLAIIMAPEPGGVEAEPRDIELALADCARQIVERDACDWVFAEGGATAAAICRAMGWTSLDVEAELASGVVVLKPDADVRLIIKPGSYAWPKSVVDAPTD